MVEDDRLVEPPLEVTEGAGQQKQRVPPEPGAEARDGGRGAAEGAGDLAVGGAGLQSRGDRQDELGALEIEGDREALPGEGAAAGGAAEARHRRASPGGVGTVAPEAGALCPDVRRTLGPGAEAGIEMLQSLDRGAWPVHAAIEIKLRARPAPIATSAQRRIWILFRL